jgi:hypothetical protein
MKTQRLPPFRPRLWPKEEMEHPKLSSMINMIGFDALSQDEREFCNERGYTKAWAKQNGVKIDEKYGN